MNMKRAITLLFATGMLLPLPASSTYILDGGTGTGSNRLSFTGYIEETVGNLDSFDVYWTDGTKKAPNGDSLDIAQSLENSGKTKAEGTLLRWKATGQPSNNRGSSLSITIGITVSPLVGEDGRTVVPGTISFSRAGTSYTGESTTYDKRVNSDGSCTWTYTYRSWWSTRTVKVVTETATKAEDTAEKATWTKDSGADDRKSWKCTYTVKTLNPSDCRWNWSGDVAIDMKTDGLPSQKYEGTIWIDISSK